MMKLIENHSGHIFESSGSALQCRGYDNVFISLYF